jgi:hypothetical protein
MITMKRYFFIFLLFTSHLVSANEGMWLPQMLEQLNEKEMRAMGMKISAKDIYNINKGSLKDAIVSFGGFCTAEVISQKGLLLTNHHCGFDAIQVHSSMQNNYLRDGFWAKSLGAELPNAGLTATFIVRIEDVTSDILKGVTGSMDERTRQSTIDKNLAAIRKDAKKESWQDVLIRPFYYGNQYYLFITETFKDIRLVGAPPSSIGKFGADTDNWIWPRHTGDFSMFRIYADQNNRPAEYAVNNVPYQPKYALSISLDGVAENDFTMVFGFPGRTQEYLPASAVKMMAEVLNPVKINIRDQTLKIWDSYMRGNEAIKLQYSSKYAGIANAWKKWIGESQGIAQTGAIAKKQVYEASFQQKVAAHPTWNASYGDLLGQINTKYAEVQPYALVRDHFTEITNAVELFTITGELYGVVAAYLKEGKPGFEKARAEALSALEPLFKDYHPEIDQKVFASLMDLYFRNVPPSAIGKEATEIWNDKNNAARSAENIFDESKLIDFSSVQKILSQQPEEAVKDLEKDIAMRFSNSLVQQFTSSIAQKLNAIQAEINQLQREYMKAQMEVMKEKRFYPDANSTLRLTYGQVKGYSARDAVQYDHYTYLDGVMEKYKPGDYEFDVPQKLVSLYRAKDYGPYAQNGKLPVCFIGTNHTTGGNSGSPALDAYGNLVGLNFDRVWEGTMSDLNYDPAICRNIMVDIRYILFIVDKYAGAGNLLAEMKLVHPKKKF